MWTYARPLAQQDMPSALGRMASSINATLPTIAPGDVALHLRLHFQYGMVRWPVRSTFVGRLPEKVTQIHVLHQPFEGKVVNGQWKPADRKYQLARACSVVSEKPQEAWDLDDVLLYEVLQSILRSFVYELIRFVRPSLDLFCSSIRLCVYSSIRVLICSSVRLFVGCLGSCYLDNCHFE